MSSFTLKIIALISMSFDHIGIAFFGSSTFFNIIGRIAFPIFAFQISEGYKHTKNLKAYIFRLCCFAFASQIPFTLFFISIGVNKFELNVLFTLILGLLSIIIYDKINLKYNNKIIGFLPVSALIILSQICNCDYGWYGVTIIFLFYIFKDKKIYMNISIITSTIIKYTLNYIALPNIYNLYFAFGTLISLLFINLYNNKKGKNIKYLLYIFYPLHLIILALINFLY